MSLCPIDYNVQQTHQQKIHNIKSTYASSSQKIAKDGKKNTYHDDFMDLDEFFTRSAAVEGPTEDSFKSDEIDHPKPNVDLLASLLTLGKMIQDQKQLIKQQQHQQQQQQNPQNRSILLQQDISSPIISNSVPPTLQSPAIQSVAAPTSLLSTMADDRDLSKLSQPDINSGHCSNLLTYNIQNENQTDRDNSSQTSSSSKRAVIPEEIKDLDYWDRRKRNNLAAKKSREERRRKELEILEAAKQLEKENSQLATMLKRLTARNELLEGRLQEIRKRQLKTLSSGVDEDNGTSTS